MGTPSEEVGYSLAITITLCTPAPLCPLPPPPSPCPLRCSSCFAPLVRVWTRRFLFLSLLVFSHRFFAMSFPSPLGPRSSCCIDHGYSAIVFNLPCSCCGCRLQENFACLSLLRTLLEFLSFSLFSLSLVCFLHCSSLSSPCCLAPQVGINFSSHRTFLRTFASPPTLCTSFHSRNGHRNSWDEIDDYDVGTTPNDQQLLVDSSPCIPLSPLTDPTCSPIFFFLFSRSSSFYFFAISSYLFLFRCVFHFYMLLLECFSHSK